MERAVRELPWYRQPAAPYQEEKRSHQILFKLISPGFSWTIIPAARDLDDHTKGVVSEDFNNYVRRINEYWVDDTVILGPEKRSTCSLEPRDGDGRAIGPRYFVQR